MGRHKDRLKAIVENLENLNAMPDQMLTDLDRLETECIEGYKQQKQTAKGTVVTLVERDLRTAVACIKVKWLIVKALTVIAESDDEEGRDYQFELHVISKPQDVLGDSEDF